MLKERDNALDLMLRGYGREQVKGLTGIDIGYNGRALRGQARGLDRVAYKVEHVKTRVDVVTRMGALDLVRRGCSRADVLAMLGLAGPDLIPLEKLFAGIGLGEEFASARKQGRQELLQAGMVAAHGVTSGFALPQVQDKAAQVRQERYGAPFTLAAGSTLADGVRASIARKRATSGEPSNDLLESLQRRLVDHFGFRDIQVGQGGWSFHIVSRKLCIEVIEHGSLLDDPGRCEAARRAGLNLVVFRCAIKGMDVDLWFALGCPDGTDWEHDYSWVGDRIHDDLSTSVPWPERLTGSVGISRKAAKAANGEVFYARELALWCQNPPSKMGSLRGRLLCNRHHYLGKLPHELNDLDLLRGMRISGLVRGYTAFDSSGLRELIEHYRPSSVYDPCAGWGERLATCAGLGVSYFGVDVNEAVVRGHQAIVQRYGLSEQTTMVADSACFDARGRDHEMVFTCPPYGDVEVYTAHGAENLDLDEFLDWWSQTVEMAVSDSTKVFAYQINQTYRDSMNQRVQSLGWRLVDQIDVGRGAVSHFNRDEGGVVRRGEFEQVQVFERVSVS